MDIYCLIALGVACNGSTITSSSLMGPSSPGYAVHQLHCFTFPLLDNVLFLRDFLAVPTQYIPWHYEHIADRYGAWIMLMLGESVLSIILNPVEDDWIYYCSFFTALVIAQVIQLTHYSSEEFDPSNHALSRDVLAGRLWLELMAVFSIALNALGAGLQLLLTR